MPIPILTNDRRTRDMSRDAIGAICADNDPPTLFARADDNLHITRWGERIQPMDKALVTHLGEEHCNWLVSRKNGAVPTRMPPHVADDMLTRAPWEDLPLLKRLVRSPIILPDARILDRSGYDAATGMYLALPSGFALPPIPADPTEDDTQRASALLRSYLDEFVFATLADAANAFALFIGHLLRSVIGDNALLPMFAIDAPIQSTGKTALANAAGVLALGSEPMIASEIKDSDEWRKQLASSLLAETEVMLFDNLEVPLSDPTLAAVLTSEGMWGGRILGTNSLVNARNQTTFIVTGNNLQVGPDLRRRVVYIRMDTNMPDPSRRVFRRADFLGTLKSARPRLLAALFTWIRRWLQQGSPTQGAPILASYNPFIRAAHGLLSMVGVDQLLGNLTSFRADQDQDTLAWERWLGEWYRLWGADPQTTGDLAAALNSFQGDYSAFSDLRPSELLTYSDVDRKKLSVSLGFVLKKNQDRIYGGLKLTLGTIRDGNRRWRVVPLDRVDDPESPSTPPADSVPVVPEVPSASGSPAPVYEITEIRYTRGVGETGTTGTTGTEIEPSAGARAHARGARNRRWTLSAFSRATRAPAVSVVSLDTETTGLRWWADARMRLVTLATADEVIWADTWAQPEALEDLRVALATGVTVAMHNSGFDLGVLGASGVGQPAAIFDTMLASQLLDAGGEERQGQSLEALAERYLGVALDKSYQRSDWSGDLSPEQIEYACQDARVTCDLAMILRQRIQDEGLTEALEIEHGFVPFMIALQAGGLAVDQVRWLSLEQHVIEQRLRLETSLAELYAGTPPERWTAKGWLEEYMVEHGLVTEYTSQGKPSLSKTALEAAQHDPLIAAYTAWKPFEKRGSTWGTKFLKDNLAEDGRFHGEYRQLGTRTGRLSCDRPNLQNIPHGGYREALRPPDGRCFVKADYSQLQLVIIADESLDPIMCAAYDPRLPHAERPDLHTITARAVLGMHIPDGERVKGVARVVAKGINFGLCYGLGAQRLADIITRESGVPCSLEVAQEHKRRYFQTYSGVAHWHGLSKHRSTRGRTHEDEDFPNPIDVRSPSGRRRSAVWEFQKKVNSPIQMREADGVKCGLALLLPRLAQFHDARPSMMIHDEVLVECDVAEAQEVARVVASSLEEGMNRWLKHTTATVEVDIVQDYAGTSLTI
jgi:DNA polymerase-1